MACITLDREKVLQAEFCLKIMKKLNINYKKINIVSVEQSDLFAYRPKGMMMNTINLKTILNSNTRYSRRD